MGLYMRRGAGENSSSNSVGLLENETRVALLPRERGSAEGVDGNGDVRKHPSKLLGVCLFILANELCERLAYNGLSTNLIVYFTEVIGLSKPVAAQQVNIWSGMCFVTGLLGAWVADEFLGRYRTIVWFSMLYLVGCILLTLSSFVPPMAPIEGEANGASCLVPLFVALYLIALGTGGIKSNVSSFGADQFDVTIEQDKREKDSFFNWFYLVINVGSLISSTVVVYIQEDISWAIGFAVPTSFMALAIILFVLGSSSYKMSMPAHSPISRFVSVICDAFRNTFNRRSRELFSILAASKETGSLTWLDRATKPIGRFTSSQVYEVKLVAGLTPVMLVSIVYWMVYAQMGTSYVLQGLQMNREAFGILIPPAAIVSANTLSIIVLIPIFDRFVYPGLKRAGLGMSLLQKMGWGMVFAALSLLYAGLLERYRLHQAHAGHLIPSPDGGPPSADVSILWQTPAYVLIAVSEIFCSIGQLEFFYDQAPDSMRSCCMAMQLLSTALGSFLSSGVVAIVSAATASNPWMPYDLNDGHMDYFFLVLTLIMVVDIGLHILVAANYKLKIIEHSLETPAARRPATPSAPATAAEGRDNDDDGGEDPSRPFIAIEQRAGSGSSDGSNSIFPARSLTATEYSPAIPSVLR